MSRGQLCHAIRQRFLVQLRYGDDRLDRVFAPHVVYRSSADNLLVGGAQIFNAARPEDEEAPRFLNLARIHDLRVSAERFTPRAWFDPRDERFRDSIVCHVHQED
ncbi:MAG: hypothetical protein INR68_07520 [Methylobacterium mesophilicum]|nr:hypothetical protein [Methylobacterium mesophilicum]